DFPYTDVEGDAAQSITISTLNLAAGDTLKLSGNSVTPNQTITVANLPNLIYTPASGQSGLARSTFTFKVNDADNGTVAATLTIDVSTTNEAPVAQPSSVSTDEDVAKPFAVSDFQFTDRENDELVSITISNLGLASGDKLQLNGLDVTLNQTIV